MHTLGGAAMSIRGVSRKLATSALICTAASSMLVEAAAAQFVTPSCSQSLPGLPQLFTAKNNVTSALATPAGTSLAAAEASTAQTMEVVAQRRADEAEFCPKGFTKVGGVCQPARKIASAEPSSSAPATPIDTGATLTSSGKTKQSPRPSIDTSEKRRSVVAANTRMKLEPESTRNDTWSDAFADYERRTGLGGATGSASRSQTTVGTLFGVDHAVWSGNTGMIFGFLGGFSSTRQEFQATRNLQANTTFDVSKDTLLNSLQGVDWAPYFAPGGAGFGTSGFQYTLPDNHTVETDQTQTLTGPSAGLTFSIFKGGFFSDAIAKADFLNLNSTTTGTDTHSTSLAANFEFPGNGGDVGCISTASGGPPFVISGRQTTALPAVAQSTPAINFIVAENIGYHIDLAQGFWIEPLIGARYNYSTYGSNATALGLEDGQAVRVQGGARFGLTSLVQDGHIWTNSFTALLYSDVWISGFVVGPDSFSAGALLADQGQLRGEGLLTSRLDLLNGFSFLGEVQGRIGQDYYGIGGRVGARYEW